MSKRPHELKSPVKFLAENGASITTKPLRKVNDMTSLASNEQFAQPQVAIVNGVAKTTSKDVAAFFNKRHDNVLRAIKSLDCSEKFNALNFEVVYYLDEKGESRAMYNMTKDGFVFLVMGFTGKEAAQFKESYIYRFNDMEATLKGETIPKLTRTTITPEQQATLHAIVDRRVNGFDSLRGGLWKRHNKHFGIAKYSQLLASRFDDAVVYLETAELRYPKPKEKINDGCYFLMAKDGVVIYQLPISQQAINSELANNKPLLLEHIKQVVGEFVGKEALPAPKPTLDINYPAISARPRNSFLPNQHWYKASDFVNGNFDPVRDFLDKLEQAGYEVTGLKIINNAKTWIIQQQDKAFKQIEKGYKGLAEGVRIYNEYGMGVTGFTFGNVTM